MTHLYRWATLDNTSSMATFIALHAEGYVIAGTAAHHASLLMRKDITNESTTTAGGSGNARWVNNTGGSTGSEHGNSNAPSTNFGASNGG